MKGKRILEVNPRHPLIQQVKDKFEADPDSAANGALAKILYETALLESGFQVGPALLAAMPAAKMTDVCTAHSCQAWIVMAFATPHAEAGSWHTRKKRS